MKIFNKNEWKKVKLGDIFNLQMGKTPLRENKLYWNKGEYNWISISDMNFSEKYVSFTKEKITNLAVKESGIKIIPKNTVIMSFKLSIGKVKIVNDDIYSNEAIMAFIPKENIPIDKNFLYYSLKSIKWNEGINKAVKGLTLNKALISQKEIFLPNLAIQKEIASNLDSIADFLDLRRKQLNYLKELNKSLFTTMFGDPLLNDKKEWNFFKIKDIGKIISGSTPSTNISEYWNGEYLWITPAELNDDSFIINSTNRKLTYLGVKTSSLIELPIGTVLLSSRAPIGKVAIVGENMFCNQGFKNIIPNEKINSIYLYYVFKEKKEYLNFLGRGATFKELSKEIVENISIKVPPIELQNKFAERIEKIEKLKFEIEKSIEMAQNLYNSLISKYFDN
ncbi:restriction endonuclease subunit S [uncultured Fusobacterium sp.]|uniref:restriction endonuclease subunit S n=1 Tax=uncultured Fusobacterium sp. TaxID=159267 RepID=UPI0026363EA9|nr:restriction endonuclease subunit S [uncultured Fusobacterium sp.]